MGERASVDDALLAAVERTRTKLRRAAMQARTDGGLADAPPADMGRARDIKQARESLIGDQISGDDAGWQQQRSG